jgi:hypothetical protein
MITDVQKAASTVLFGLWKLKIENLLVYEIDRLRATNYDASPKLLT